MKKAEKAWCGKMLTGIGESSGLHMGLANRWPHARLFPARFLSLKVEAMLSRRLYDINDRLSLTLEVKSAAAISETGVVGNVVVCAVVAGREFIA